MFLVYEISGEFGFSLSHHFNFSNLKKYDLVPKIYNLKTKNCFKK